VPVKVLEVLEQRMKAFVESRTTRECRAFSLGSQVSLEEIERIFLQRFVLAELASGEHSSDDHSMMNCYLCGSIFSSLRPKHEGKVREFLQTHQDLLAEIEFTR